MKLSALLVVFALAVGGLAATYSVSTEAELDAAVTAVNAGAGGDKIYITTSEFTLTTVKTFTKQVEVYGAGEGLTVLNGHSSLTGLFDFGQVSGSSIHDLTLVNNHSVGSSYCVRVRGQDHRVYNTRFIGGTTKILGLYVRATSNGNTIPTGVSYNNTFLGARAADMQGDAAGNSPWVDAAIVPGGSRAWFTEDCYVDRVWDVGRNMWDHAYGAASVTRYCTIVDSSVYGHGHDTDTNTDRSTRLMEVYGNTFIRDDLPVESPVRCNGGMVIVWGNTVTGSFNSPDNNFDLSIPTGRMSGKTEDDYPLLDQPGRALDSSLWSSAGSPPASQGLAPAYEWSNTLNGGDIDFAVDTNGTATFVVEGRDFYNDTAMPGYTPYTYPHPLRTQTFATPVARAGGRRSLR